ncbi:uncharacterized protein [Dysidea avara]
MDWTPQSSELHNFLFRGNQPINGTQFAYTSLVTTMRSLAKSAGHDFPDNFTLLDVSYLNVFEEKDYMVEKKFFEANPNKGTLYNKIIVGSLIPPPQNDLTLTKDTVKAYVENGFDKLPEKMKFFRDLLYTKGDRPIVIYGHCEAGTDRTGEVSGAYYMKYLNLTFTEALYINNHIQNRDMYKASRNAMQWYCFYLRFVEQFNHLSCMLPNNGTHLQ